MYKCPSRYNTRDEIDERAQTSLGGLRLPKARVPVLIPSWVPTLLLFRHQSQGTSGTTYVLCSSAA